ncbi:DNA polymerase/3'-5' exonuclease PolX, partial [Candidatus Woesearchaeota archaeon]|nr:DNA polymerase/3'-5' exonuclease PolX [Candidatus Woesearchaeota archaeon]
MPSNKEIADIFYEIADRLEMEDERFKVRAYRRAAETIESLPKGIEVYKDNLTQLPGIGEAIAKKIKEILETGKLGYLEKLRRQMPVDIQGLRRIEGLGPKKIKVLWEKLGIRNVEDLKKAAEQGKIRNLEGFGAKTEQDILEAIKFAQGATRFSLGLVLPLAEQLASELSKYAERVDICGSVRRMKDTIGDLDILAISTEPQKLMDVFTRLPGVAKVLLRGLTKTSIILRNGLQVDLRVVGRESYGSALQYFTGSKQHNVKLRTIAKGKGMKLSEYGLFKGDERIGGGSEEEIYKALGLEFVPPELREDRGEIEAAQQGKLPKLVCLEDIKGDLHIHSDWSDGRDSIRRLAQKCIELGYEYMGVCDHVGRLRIAGALDYNGLREQWKEIDQLNKELAPFRILKGAEVNIDKKGNIDLPEDVLKQLDIVVASIHFGFKGSEEEMTKRICKAMENPYVTCIGHPTGRMIGIRPGYALAMERVFEKARATGTLLEINSHPARLDLNDVHAKGAIEHTMLVINTDAHALEHLGFIRYGVAMARRGWCTKA